MTSQSHDQTVDSKGASAIDVRRRTLLGCATTGGIAAVALGATALLRSGKAEANGSLTSIAALTAAIAALPSWGGYLGLAPGQYQTSAAPILLSGLRGVTLDLSGVSFVSVAQINDPQLLVPGIVSLLNCTDCVVKGGTANCGGFGHSYVGLMFCTDCTVQDARSTDCLAAMGGFGSVGGIRNTWKACRSYAHAGQARGFILGGSNAYNPVEIETDLSVKDCWAHDNGATGIAVTAIGAQIIGNTCLRNQGAGICSSSSTNAISAKHVILGNRCNANAFWGWQSDVYNQTSLKNLTVQGNDFTGNAAGSALLNLCQNFDYSGNVEDGIVQVIASSNGKARLSPGATLKTNGPPNTNVTFPA